LVKVFKDLIRLKKNVAKLGLNQPPAELLPSKRKEQSLDPEKSLSGIKGHLQDSFFRRAKLVVSSLFRNGHSITNTTGPFVAPPDLPIKTAGRDSFFT